jgi:hypothetical protein
LQRFFGLCTRPFFLPFASISLLDRICQNPVCDGSLMIFSVQDVWILPTARLDRVWHWEKNILAYPSLYIYV